MMNDEQATDFLDEIIDYCDLEKISSLDINESGIAAFSVMETACPELTYAISIGRDKDYFMNCATVITVQIVTESYIITVYVLKDNAQEVSYMLKNALFAFEKDTFFLLFFDKFFSDNKHLMDKNALDALSQYYRVSIDIPFVRAIEEKETAKA